jgi:hypothetical protein
VGLIQILRRVFSRGKSQPQRPLAERERQILERELAESQRNPMASPASSLSGPDAKTSAAAANPSQPGSAFATGIPGQSLGETKGK